MKDRFFSSQKQKLICHFERRETPEKSDQLCRKDGRMVLHTITSQPPDRWGLRFLRFAFGMTLLFLFITPAFAQNNDSVQSLGDILNEKPDYGTDGKPLTSALMANHYYKNCMHKESLIFDTDQKKTLCGCTSAKMSETLSVQDFKDLDQKTKRGRDARGRMLAYAYAPCMGYVIDDKTKADCRRAGALKDIVRGRKIVCDCVAERLKKHIRLNTSHIIMSAMNHDPMTLDPLEHYFTAGNYYPQYDHFMRQCRFNFQYNRDNR